jgi:hypothetical protein
VPRSEANIATALAENCAEQLAHFFPQTSAVRVPVQVMPLGGGSRLRESTVLEYANAEHAIFVSTLPLEFAERVKVQSAPQNSSKGNGSARMEEGTVVAVQYHEGRKAVAVRFRRGQCNWVTEP